jgi:hypothetical protein
MHGPAAGHRLAEHQHLAGAVNAAQVVGDQDRLVFLAAR